MFNSFRHAAGKGTPRSDAWSALTQTSDSWIRSFITMAQRKVRLLRKVKAAPRSPAYLFKFAIMSTRTHTSVCTHVQARESAQARKRARVCTHRGLQSSFTMSDKPSSSRTRRIAASAKASTTGSPQPELSWFFHELGKRTPCRAAFSHRRCTSKD